MTYLSKRMLFHRWKLVYTESSDFTKRSSPFIPSLPCTSCLPLVISTSQVYIMVTDWEVRYSLNKNTYFHSIFRGMNIHKSEDFFDVNKRGNKVLTHPYTLYHVLSDWSGARHMKGTSKMHCFDECRWMDWLKWKITKKKTWHLVWWSSN